MRYKRFSSRTSLGTAALNQEITKILKESFHTHDLTDKPSYKNVNSSFLHNLLVKFLKIFRD